MYLKLKKITSIKMDSATLLDGLWPLENEGLGTAVVEEHERERFEWHGKRIREAAFTDKTNKSNTRCRETRTCSQSISFFDHHFLS